MEHAIAGLVALAGALLFSLRLARIRAQTPHDLGRESADVSVIVPARDEAHNLPTLLRSLRLLSPPPREIIVVDDGSSDATGEIARGFGATVLSPPPRPAHFIGKPWACLAGARAASGRFLLFTDADTAHAPDSLARALSALVNTRAGLLSLIPTHRVEAGWERLQGVFQLLLLLATRADTRALHRRGARPFAIGQYLLFRRQVYDAIGGHAATPGRIAEDLALARLVAEAGYGVCVLHAERALSVRMYPEGLRAFFAGWRRNFRDGLAAAGVRATLELTLVIGWLLGVPLWLVQALSSGALGWAVGWAFVYLATALVIAREQRRYGNFSPASALVYPLFVLVFVAVSVAAAWDALRKRPVTWRGRSFAWTR